MVVSTHAGLMRAGTGVIDSRARIEWALQALSAYDTVFEAHDQPVELAAVARVHQPSYLRQLGALAQAGPARLDPELVFEASLWFAARCACAAVLAQARAAQASQIRWCLSRPGSHHAGADYALGGCVLNHLAVAAADALARGMARVAIIDFDAHHGNGTQEIFYANSQVLCISLHQYPFFPGSGAPDERGVGAAAGTNLNIILCAGAGTATARSAYERALETLLAYSPELVLFEAGLDGHEQDPTSDLCFEDATFHTLGALTAAALAALAVPAVFELGGGYSEAALRGGLPALLSGLGVGLCLTR